MTPEERDLIQRIEGLVYAPQTDVNDLANAYIVLLEIGANQQATRFFREAESRMAMQFTDLSDSVIKRLYDDLVRAPIFPPRPRDSWIITSLEAWNEVQGLGWRLRYSSAQAWSRRLQRLQQQLPPWAQPVTQSLGGPRSGGVPLPPVSYEQFKSQGAQWPANDNLMAIEQWTTAGALGVLTGVLYMLMGADMDTVNQGMRNMAPIDGALMALAGARAGAHSDAGRGGFGPVAETQWGAELVPRSLTTATNAPMSAPPVTFFAVPSFILQKRAGNDNHLENISGDFQFWEGGEGLDWIKEARGSLGVPGRVVTTRVLGADGQRGVSAGSGDHAGHLIATRFGAPGDARNLSLQNWKQNTGGGTWYAMEDHWAELLKNGYQVNVSVRDYSKLGENRPYKRNATWSETAPDGTVTRHSMDFVNTHTPASRNKQGQTPEEQRQFKKPQFRVDTTPRFRIDPSVPDGNYRIGPDEMDIHPTEEDPYYMEPPKQQKKLRVLDPGPDNDDPFGLKRPLKP